MTQTVSDAVAPLDVADIGTANAAGCVELLRHVRRTRGWLDAVEARIGSRMRHLAAAGGAPAGVASTAAADAHGRVGGVSAAEGRP